MDPDVLLGQIIDAAVAGDEEEFRRKSEDLAAWFARGGFHPFDPRLVRTDRRLS